MIKRKRLGQHFLNSNSIAQLIVSSAEITKDDVVYEVGTGLGILTPLLCRAANHVISIDADKKLSENAQTKYSNTENLILKHGDGFKKEESFSIFVSNLPYSRSKDAIEWLAQRTFSRAVIMVQKEFADKILESSHKQRKAISVVANHCFEIKKLQNVSKNNFTPPPKVDSIVLKITSKNVMTSSQIKTVNKLFSYRRKTVKNMLKQFNKETKIEKRFSELTGDEIIELAHQILKK